MSILRLTWHLVSIGNLDYDLLRTDRYQLLENMKLYTCDYCGSSLYFENHLCFNCSHTVGFEADLLEIITLEQTVQGTYQAIHDRSLLYRFCNNVSQGVCNWLIPNNQPDLYCKACSLNRTIPTLYKTENIEKWRAIEIAKHRLVYSLLQLKLPVQPKNDLHLDGVTFDFLEDEHTGKKVMTGHQDGVITLNLDEADEANRVRNKQDLGEKYRTLLGHFRHEIGHYYWDLLIRDTDYIHRYREIFGNENVNYEDSLKRYYNSGAPANWMNDFITPYAASHPWEDWAETWAHYLHMMDTLETAHAFGLGLQAPQHGETPSAHTQVTNPYTLKNFEDIIVMWLPLTFAVNSLNRSMGHPDFYPFVISENVNKKLAFIHQVCNHNNLMW